MKEYPSTLKSFTVNGKEFVMRQFTLGLQAAIEDEDTKVTILGVVTECTSMEDEDILSLDNGQINSIFEDIQAFTYTTESKEGGEPKKP